GNERSPGRRRALIADTWVDQGYYVDPHRRGEKHDGIDAMIQAVQERFPTYRFRLSSAVDAHNDRVRFTWEAGGTAEAAMHVVGTGFGRIATGLGAIVTSSVKDLLMPPIGLALGGVNFEDLFVTLSGGSYPSLAAAKAAGAPTLNYGIFINTIINFVIVAFAVFLLVRQIDRLRATPAPPSPSTKECSQCAMAI